MSAASAVAAPTPARSLQARAIILCAIVAFLDGFDTQALGPAAKPIATALGFPVGDLGPVFSASQIGFLVGALTFGALGDRLGRKRVLIGAVALFGLCSLATAFASNFETLFAARLLAGLGLGGATPNFVSLASEYAPPEKRARIVTMMWAAVPLGGMTAALATAALLPGFGWKMTFYIGFVAPMLLIGIMLPWLPESREAKAVSQDNLGLGTALFGENRWLATIWLWLASLTGWMTLIVVVFWTPALLAQSGLSASAAASILAFHNVGGILGTLTIGALIGRLTPQQALTIALVASGLSVIAMGQSIGVFPLLAGATVFAGFFGSAAGAALIAVSSRIYPESARASGVGFALGAGRLGTIVGPMLVGLLIASAWPVSRIYLAIALPAFAAALFITLLARARHSNL